MKTLKLLIPLFLIFVTGCSNIFIADNTVLTINDENENIAIIDSINFKQPGKVCSKTKENKLLSINKTNNLYSIDMYDPVNSTLVNLTTTENRIFDVQAAQDGFFYTRNNISDPSNILISWSSYDKTKERTITNQADSVDDTIYAYDGDKVIFINNGNELIFSDSSGKRKSYTLSFPIDVRKIKWSSKNSTGFIIGRELEEDEFNLYEIILSDNDSVSINTIANNVMDMDLNKNDELVYLEQTSSKTIAYIINNFETVNKIPLFSENIIDNITFDVDNKGIIYSVQNSTGIRSNLWYFDKKNQKKTQLTSSIRLISSIFSTKANQIIYSISQQSYIENNSLIESNNYITNLIYSIK